MALLHSLFVIHDDFLLSRLITNGDFFTICLINVDIDLITF